MSHRQRRIYHVLLSVIVLWCGLIVLAPLLAAVGSPVAATLYRFFAPVCHQDAARSFLFNGFPCAVCIRCSAIYFGFLGGVLLTPLLRRWPIRSSVPLWGVAVTPMLIDVAAELFGIHQATVTTRTASGIIFGLIAGYALLPDFIEAIAGFFSPPTYDARSSHE
jgi:uncharacterized membrane protein